MLQAKPFFYDRHQRYNLRLNIYSYQYILIRFLLEMHFELYIVVTILLALRNDGLNVYKQRKNSLTHGNSNDPERNYDNDAYSFLWNQKLKHKPESTFLQQAPAVSYCSTIVLSFIAPQIHCDIQPPSQRNRAVSALIIVPLRL